MQCKSKWSNLQFSEMTGKELVNIIKQNVFLKKLKENRLQYVMWDHLCINRLTLSSSKTCISQSKMLVTKNCFCSMVVWWKAFSLISSWDHCQRYWPSWISIKQNLNLCRTWVQALLNEVEQQYTTTPPHH